MVTRIKQAVKNRPTRERKKLIVVGTDGNNKTEVQYLRNLEKQLEGFHFIFVQGTEIDLVSIVRNTIHQSQEMELSFKQGDMAMCIFNLGLDDYKNPRFDEVKRLAALGNVCVISFSPCYQLWYLEYSGYICKHFSNSYELIRVLKERMSEQERIACNLDKFYPLNNQEKELKIIR